jgi:hypothetical protein
VSEIVQAALDRALEAYAALASLGEEIEDEWSYVNDLADAWQRRLAEIADLGGPQPLPEAVSIAVDRAIAEIAEVTDPHRAIDWLSTFPQVVLLAMGETP